MKRALTLLAAALLAGSLTGCGDAEHASLSTTQPVAAATDAEGMTPPGPPQLADWDHPLDDAQTVNDLSAVAAQIPFSVSTPRFGVAPALSEVTPAATAPDDQTVAFAYHFPLSSALPTDGHVVVLEHSAKPYPPDFIAQLVATDDRGTGQFKLVNVGGVDAALIEAHGIARVTMIKNGLLLDIMGPGLTHNEALRLAALL